MPIALPDPDIRTCQKCRKSYSWRRSTSWTLKNTYCTAWCERSDLGFTVEALMRNDIKPAVVAVDPPLPVDMDEKLAAFVGRG